MDSLRNIGISSQPSSVSSVRQLPTVADVDQAQDMEEYSQSDVELSSLAKQLSAAAERVSARDAQLSRKELAALAERIWERIAGGSYFFSKSAHDSFVPNTEDPELLERARQATAFINGRGDNPFTSLSREQLSAIVYDEGGDFTTNERHAAWKETNKRDSEWTVNITRKMAAERQLTGRNDDGLREVLAYYKALPPIEEAQIKGNYEADIMMGLSSQEVDWPKFNTSLIDMLAHEWKPSEPPVTPEQPDPAADPTGKAPD